MKLKHKRLDAECDWCHKQKKEVIELEMESGKEVKLCWRDLQKMAGVELKTSPSDNGQAK